MPLYIGPTAHNPRIVLHSRSGHQHRRGRSIRVFPTAVSQSRDVADERDSDPDPLWFVRRGSALFMGTSPDSFKVRRIRNNPRVRSTPGTMRGYPRENWLQGKAELVTGFARYADLNPACKVFSLIDLL